MTTNTTTYTVTDLDDGCEAEIIAETAERAARKFVRGGDYQSDQCTVYVHCAVRDAQQDDDEGESITVTVHPLEPECVQDAHDWRSPREVLGGCEENPGVWGHGGGVIIRVVCAHCGCYRRTDTWATDPSTGKQGLEEIVYEDADAESRAWSMRQQSEDYPPHDEECEEDDGGTSLGYFDRAKAEECAEAAQHNLALMPYERSGNIGVVEEYERAGKTIYYVTVVYP